LKPWPKVAASAKCGRTRKNPPKPRPNCAYATLAAHTSRTIATGRILFNLPGSLTERSVVLRHHLLELIGHFVRAREDDRFVPRFDLAPQPELDPLQPLCRERLQALQLLRVLVDALVLEAAQRRKNLLQFLRIDVETTQRAAQVLRFVRPLPRLGAKLADVLVREAAEVGAVVVRAVPRQVAVPVAAAVVGAPVVPVLIPAVGAAAGLLATLLTAALLAASLLAALALLTTLTLLAALALLTILTLLAILALLTILALLAVLALLTVLTLLAVLALLALLAFLALLIALLLAALVRLALLLPLLIAALLVARVLLGALAGPLLQRLESARETLRAIECLLGLRAGILLLAFA
jgi:hypothetical protein